MNEYDEKMMRRHTKTMIVLVTLTVLMTISVIVLAVFLGLSKSKEREYKMGVENVYRHAYYSLLENYVDIETGLSKIKVLSSAGLSEEILGNVADNAELAGLSLSTLNTESNNLESIFRFTNQVGDYSKYLVRKLENGGKISEEEYSTLDKMHKIATKLGRALAGISDEINIGGYQFVDSLGNENDAFSLAISELEDGSIEYPSLIYDGPFSDALDGRQPHELTGEDITIEDGAKKVSELFDGIEEVTFISENSNRFDTYLYSVKFQDGALGSVQLTKKGGHIVMFNSFAAAGDVSVDDKKSIDIARTFLEGLGYENMECVWNSLSNGCYYVNFAYVENGVICYADLIKIKVLASNGRIVGMESLNYIYNHRTREIDTSGIISEEEIISKVTSAMDISSVRLALIPKGNDSEVLTYEITGTIDKDVFYLYVDAKTGEDVKVLMQINSSGGNLLL